MDPKSFKLLVRVLIREGTEIPEEDLDTITYDVIELILDKEGNK
jgi:hypothetical protein